jgi:hypothetical protein
MSGLRLISESLPGVAGKAFGRKYIMLGRLVTHWHDIVGPELAGKTQPVKIRYYGGGKSKAGAAKKSAEKPTASLDIAASTADATVLHYQKDLILERINQIFGDRWITAVRFVPQASNAPRRPLPRLLKPLTAQEKAGLEMILASVKDEELGEKLRNMGTALLQDRKS